MHRSVSSCTIADAVKSANGPECLNGAIEYSSLPQQHWLGKAGAQIAQSKGLKALTIEFAGFIGAQEVGF